MKRVLQFLIKIYSSFISPLLGRNCRFVPTCSAYAYEAIERHGAFKGVCLSIKRILKCHPWCRCDMHDPVPKQFTWGAVFGYKNSGKTTK